MPIGTTAAILGAAVIGAGSSAIASRNNNRAINQATAAQTESNASSIALQRDVYNSNSATLNPFIQRGNAAGATMNALLGLGGSIQPSQPAQTQPNGALSGYNPANDTGYGGQPFVAGGNQIDTPIQDVGNIGGGNQGAPNAWMPQTGGQPTATEGVTAPQGMSAQEAATQAYNIFKQSTGYQDRLTEGYRATNAGYAANGLLQSGAAQKALLRYGQQQASGEFGNFMGYLGNQQGVGLSGASALAGVGQGYANNVSNLNSANAAAIGQSAVARANNSNSTIGGIANIAGSTVGALSSYGSPRVPPPASTPYPWAMRA